MTCLIVRYLLDARPVNILPAMIIGTFWAVAINVHPKAPGIAASFTVFSLPTPSIRKPPKTAPTGTTTTITLAVN